MHQHPQCGEVDLVFSDARVKAACVSLASQDDPLLSQHSKEQDHAARSIDFLQFEIASTANACEISCECPQSPN